MADKNGNTGDKSNQQQQTTATAEQQPAAVAATAAVQPAATAATTQPTERKRMIVFHPPSYAGKDLTKRRNLADAVIDFTDTLTLGGFVVAGIVENGQVREVVVYPPKAGMLTSSPSAIRPRMVPAPAGVETESGMVLAPGARGADSKMLDAIRAAWGNANANGQNPFGREVELPL